VESDLSVESSPVGPVVHPPNPGGTVILYLQGRRVSSADPVSAPDRARSLALLTGATVVCSGHRSAFPEALEDVHAGYRYCHNAGPVVLAGERMGAGLAAALLVQLRDSGAALPRCAVLVSALLDLTMQAKSLLLNATADPAFDVTELRRRVPDYAGGAALTDSRLSPLYANLHGLPPIQLLAAGTDPLLDDSLAFATRAARDRVAVDLRVWPDMADLRAKSDTAMAGFIKEWSAGGSADEEPHAAPGVSSAASPQ
jgi:monoterpene epsilon-lactone hydrolase